MNDPEEPAPQNRLSPAVFLFLMLVGLFLLSLGIEHRLSFLVTLGMGYVLATMFAFRARLPLPTLLSPVVGMLLGIPLGSAIGTFMSRAAEALLGPVATVIGAIIGGATGSFLAVAPLHFLEVPILLGLLPRGRVLRGITAALIMIGVLAGVWWGARALPGTIREIFGPTGGMALAFGGLGIFLGFWLGSSVRPLR